MSVKQPLVAGVAPGDADPFPDMPKPVPEFDECLALWRGILMQALRDAVRYGDGTEAPQFIGDPMAWFDSAMCRWVCSLLDVHYPSVRRAAHARRADYLRVSADGRQVRTDFMADWEVVDG